MLPVIQREENLGFMYCSNLGSRAIGVSKQMSDLVRKINTSVGDVFNEWVTQKKTEAQMQMERFVALGNLEEAVEMGRKTHDPAALRSLVQLLLEEGNWDDEIRFFSNKISKESGKDWYVEISENNEPIIKLIDKK